MRAVANMVAVKTAASPWPARLAGAGLLAAMVVLAYIPAMRAGFIWDDSEHVTRNLTLDRSDALWRIWFDPGGQATMQFYPLSHTVFWAEHRFLHDNPLGCHLINIVLQGVNGVLLWAVLRGLRLPGAWFAAALWALHPVHVESVAWVTELKNILSGFFYLLAVLAYLRFDPSLMADRLTDERSVGTMAGVYKSPSPRRWGFYGLAMMSFAAALLSKTVTATLPAVLLLMIWWKRRTIRRRDFIPLIPLFVLGLGLGSLTVFVEKYFIGTQGVDWHLTAMQRVLIAGRALWFYAWSLVWPVHLTFSYPRWEVEPGLWWQYLFPLAAAALVAALWLWRRRVGRGPLAAVLFFALTLAPALGFFDVYPFRYSFVADHFQYLASIGPIVLATGLAFRGVRRLGARHWVTAAGGTMLALLLAGLSFRQATVYHDLETLWTDTLRKNPGSWLAMNNLGSILQQRGQREQAMSLYDHALRLNPRDAATYHNRATIWQYWAGQYGRRDYLDKALAEYNLAVECSPRYVPPREYRAMLLWSLGRFEESLSDLNVVLATVVPFKAFNVYLDRAQVLLELERFDEALSDWARYMELVPANRKPETWAYTIRGKIYYRRAEQRKSRDDYFMAVADFDRALETMPESETADRGEAYRLRGLCRLALEQLDQALSDLDRAKELLPNAAKVREYRARCLSQLRRFDEAWAEVRQCRALGGQPDPQFLRVLSEASGRSE